MSPSIPPTLGDLSWRVARHCDAGSCIRIGRSGDTVLIGDTKNPDGPILAYDRAEWKTFIEGVRHGDFDDL